MHPAQIQSIIIPNLILLHSQSPGDLPKIYWSNNFETSKHACHGCIHHGKLDALFPGCSFQHKRGKSQGEYCILFEQLIPARRLPMFLASFFFSPKTIIPSSVMILAIQIKLEPCLHPYFFIAPPIHCFQWYIKQKWLLEVFGEEKAEASDSQTRLCHCFLHVFLTEIPALSLLPSLELNCLFRCHLVPIQGPACCCLIVSRSSQLQGSTQVASVVVPTEIVQHGKMLRGRM